MKYLFYLIIISTFAFKTKEISCDKLRQGKYLALFDKQFKDNYGSFELTINDTTASRKIGFLTDVYSIKTISECNFWLSKPYSLDTSKQNDLQKQLANLGQPYYDIQIVNADTLKFVFRHNPHIMINSGTFIKIK